MRFAPVVFVFAAIGHAHDVLGSRVALRRAPPIGTDSQPAARQAALGLKTPLCVPITRLLTEGPGTCGSLAMYLNRDEPAVVETSDAQPGD